jgi:hypothetical protein
MRSTLLAGGLAFFLIAWGWAQPRQAGPVRFEGARVITGEASAPIADAAFIVESGRFTVVGARS